MNHSRIVITATVLISLLAASQAHATLMPKQEWLRTYDSPAHGMDLGFGVALDSAGNVYVTGYEDRDDLGLGYNIWLRKYDSDGNTLWTQTYDSPYHADDYGQGIALDAADNVYVTGYEDRSDLGQDINIWLRKYDSDGNTIWTETYDSPAHSHDSGHGVAVDSAGNAYVTGAEYRDDLGQSYNIWLRKYDTNGNTLWTDTYDSPYPGLDTDTGRGVAVDAAGNVYVTGYEERGDLHQQYNIWLRKYDADGNTLWTKTYDSLDHRNDYGSDVAVDAAGNVYVTGSEVRDNQGANIWLRKYDTDGNTLWTQTYDNPAHTWDQGYGVAVDAAGNVYVTGFQDYALNPNIWLRKYDTDGNILWTETYNSPAADIGQSVAVDTAGNVYVTGNSDGDIILLKYAQVPEPSMLLLLAPALFSFAAILRKKFRSVEV